MVPDGLEGTTVPDDERVGAHLGGIVKGGELLRGHVRRIEAGAGGLGADPFHEGLSVDPVPGTVVDLGILPGGRVGQGAQEGGLVTVILFPVDVVHLVRREAVQVQDFLSVVGDVRKVRSGDRHHGIVLHEARRLGPVRTAGDGDEGEENPCDCQFFHIFCL